MPPVKKPNSGYLGNNKTIGNVNNKSIGNIQTKKKT